MTQPVLNVGICGIGRIASNHAEEIASYPNLFRLVACADILPDRLVHELPKPLETAAKYHSLEEMLAHPELDVVTICVRHEDHVPMAVKIMEAGKIAVVEKPVATSLAEYDRLLDAARRHPGKLFLRHNRRFEAPFVKVRQLMDSGLIGDVQYIKLYRSVGFCRRNDWMTMTEFYGGLLSNWGPHLIDQALQLLGGKVVDIWADVRHVISIGDGDDLFKILLKADNGRLADIEVSGCNAMPGREMEIIGSRGTIVYEGGKLTARYLDPSLQLRTDLKPHPETPRKTYGNFDETLNFFSSEIQIPALNMRVLWDHLYNDAVNHIPTPVKLEEARETVRVTEEAFRKSGFQPMLRYLDAHAKA